MRKKHNPDLDWMHPDNDANGKPVKKATSLAKVKKVEHVTYTPEERAALQLRLSKDLRKALKNHGGGRTASLRAIPFDGRCIGRYVHNE